VPAIGLCNRMRRFMHTFELETIRIRRGGSVPLVGLVVGVILLALSSIVVACATPHTASAPRARTRGRYIDHLAFSPPADSGRCVWMLRTGVSDATLVAMDITATALEPTFVVEESTESARARAAQLTAAAPLPTCAPFSTPDPNGPPTPLPVWPATAPCYLPPVRIMSVGPNRVRFWATSDAALFVEVNPLPAPSPLVSATPFPIAPTTVRP